MYVRQICVVLVLVMCVTSTLAKSVEGDLESRLGELIERYLTSSDVKSVQQPEDLLKRDPKNCSCKIQFCINNYAECRNKPVAARTVEGGLENRLSELMDRELTLAADEVEGDLERRAEAKRYTKYRPAGPSSGKGRWPPMSGGPRYKKLG